MFQTCSEFESFVRPHLSRVIQAWKARIDAEPSQSAEMLGAGISDAPRESEMSLSDDPSESEDLGYLDYMEMGERAGIVLKDALARMTAAMVDLGVEISERTAAVEGLGESPNLIAAKNVANQTAGDLERFAKRIDVEVPIFAQAYADVLRSFSGAASIAVEVGRGSNRIEQALAEVEQMRLALEGSRRMLIDFAGKVRSTPRLTTHLNRAKQRAGKTMAALDSEFEKALSNNMTLEASIRDLIRPRFQDPF